MLAFMALGCCNKKGRRPKPTEFKSKKSGNPLSEAAMTFEPFTFAGIVGTAIIVAAYFANQQGWLMAEDWRYSFANLVGAILILLSLFTAWNLPAAVMEGFWALISVYGLVKHAGWGPTS